DPTMIGGAGMRRRRASVEGAPQVSSKFVALELAPAPVSGRIPPVSVAQGKSATVTCILEPGAPIPGRAEATLEGLPPRATAKPVEVAQGARRIEFQVSIASTTPVGEYPSLVCRLAGQVEGQDVVYRAGRGGLLKVNPPGATLTGPDGRPLSP